MYRGGEREESGSREECIKYAFNVDASGKHNRRGLDDPRGLNGCDYPAGLSMKFLKNAEGDWLACLRGAKQR